MSGVGVVRRVEKEATRVEFSSERWSV